jgi:hypothetical protein
LTISHFGCYRAAMATRTEDSPIPPDVMEFFRQAGARGGKMGATKRWKGVSPAARSEGARRAARARWKKKAGAKKTKG